MRNPFFLPVTLLLGFFMPTSTLAAIHLRANAAGYTPERPKSLLIQSDSLLQGKTWKILNEQGETVLSGTLDKSLGGKNSENPFAYHHEVDFNTLQTLGQYTFQFQDQALALSIQQDPYSKFITQALRHLRVMRSGSTETLLHQASHWGDSAAIVHQVSGDPSQGLWTPVNPKRTVDMRGGWYDAGDYIKFTLNESYVTWHLLTAYLENPALFPKVYSQSQWPDILDEANHGLSYLLKTFPDANTFVVQVGGKEDHQQGTRLPESDALDEKRPAYCALSRVHMGSTVAALALGARVFYSLGDSTRAALLQAKAETIFIRAMQNDVLRTVYEKDATNDFYRTEGDSAMMALGAAELYALTKESSYLDLARQWRPGVGSEVSWAEWNFFANFTLGEWDATAQNRAELEANAVATQASQSLWGYNHTFTWGTLHRWMGNASTTARIAKRAGDQSPEARLPALRITDLLFGRNPWGVSFLFTKDLPNSVQNIYSQLYGLLDQFPVGAVSEGPGDAATHQDMEEWITVNPQDPMIPFNTTSGVFYDNANDFMTQESTIGGQADVILLLTLVSDKGFVAKADSGKGAGEHDIPDIQSQLSIAASSLTWHTYTDQEEGGISTTSTLLRNAPRISVTLDSKANTTLDYQYAGINTTLPLAQRPAQMNGLYLIANIPQGQSLRVNLQMSTISDYDHFGKTIVGKGQTTYWIAFADLTQAGFGTPSTFDATKVTDIDLINEVADVRMDLSLDSLVFYKASNSSIHAKPSSDISSLAIQPLHQNVIFQWQGHSDFQLEIFDIHGALLHHGKSNSKGTAFWTPQSSGLFIAKAKQPNSQKTQTTQSFVIP